MNCKPIYQIPKRMVKSGFQFQLNSSGKKLWSKICYLPLTQKVSLKKSPKKSQNWPHLAGKICIFYFFIVLTTNCERQKFFMNRAIIHLFQFDVLKKLRDFKDGNFLDKFVLISAGVRGLNSKLWSKNLPPPSLSNILLNTQLTVYTRVWVRNFGQNQTIFFSIRPIHEPQTTLVEGLTFWTKKWL